MASALGVSVVLLTLMIAQSLVVDKLDKDYVLAPKPKRVPECEEGKHVNYLANYPPVADTTWLLNEKYRLHGGRTLLFIGIFSAPGEANRRNEVRKTWMFQDELQCFKKTKPLVRAKFIVGKTENHTEHDMLEAEAKKYDDITRIHVDEGYHNLNHKSIEYFRWFAANENAHFAMKIDDDTWPDMRSITRRLKVMLGDNRTSIYAGHLLEGHKVMTTGKWREDPKVFDETVYPAYMSGPAYIMQDDLIKKMYVANYHEYSQQILSNEDANTGLWVSKESKATCVDYNMWPVWEEGCDESAVIHMNLVMGKMFCMHKNYQAEHENICCGHQTEDHWKLRSNAGHWKKTGDGSNLIAKRGSVAEDVARFEEESQVVRDLTSKPWCSWAWE